VSSKTYLHLSIGPAGNLNNHVKNRLLLIGIEGDVVEGRDWDAILLDEDAVLESVGRSDLAGLVGGWSLRVETLLGSRE